MGRDEPSLDYGTPGEVDADVEVVRRIYDAFARRDLDAALMYIAADCEVWPQGTADALGRDAPYRGHEGVRDYFRDAARVWWELTLQADDIRAAAGGVVVFGQISGRTGDATIRRRVIWLWRLRDGRAISMRVSDIGEGDPA